MRTKDLYEDVNVEPMGKNLEQTMPSMIKAGQNSEKASGVGACENNDCGMRIEKTTKNECVMNKDWKPTTSV